MKPQTREHLAVCSLLGIPAGARGADQGGPRRPPTSWSSPSSRSRSCSPRTPFAGAAILPVSSTTGEGVPRAQGGAARPRRPSTPMPDEPDRPARLPVDRAFHLKGLGVVVTGTLGERRHPAGRHAGGPAARRARRACAASRSTASRARQAEAGERTSLQLTGIALEELARGMQLGTPEAFAATTSLLARFTLLPDAPAPLRGFVPVRLHLYASEVLGPHAPARSPRGSRRGRPGRSRSASQAPVSAVRGDRFILRRPSPAATLGGGEILDPRWRRHRGTHPPAGAGRAPGGPPRRPRPSGCRRRASAASRRPSWRAGWGCRRPQVGEAARGARAATRS